MRCHSFETADSPPVVQTLTVGKHVYVAPHRTLDMTAVDYISDLGGKILQMNDATGTGVFVYDTSAPHGTSPEIGPADVPCSTMSI